MAYKLTGEKVIGLASTSYRRRLALQQIPGVEVVFVGGGEEPDTEDLVTVALSKIAFAYPMILQMCRRNNKELSGVVAADTNTHIGVIENNDVRLASKKKPDSIQTPRKHFMRMSQLAKKMGEGYYEVSSSAALQDKTGTVAGTEVTRVVLHQEMIRLLATPDGYAQYLATFDNFYSSHAYSQNGLPPVTPQNLSGGISLPVLLKMGAVRAVDGVDLHRNTVRKVDETLHRALLNVAVGFSPNVLEKIHPEAMQYLLQWSWLQNAVNEAQNR